MEPVTNLQPIADSTLEINEIVTELRPSPTIQVMLKALELKKAGHKLYNYGIGEMHPEITIPQPIKDGITSALESNCTHYCSPQGDPELIEAICEDFRTNYSLNFLPSQIVVSAGPKDTFSKICMALLNPFSKRNRVIAFAPTFESFVAVPPLLTGQPTILLETDIEGLPNLPQLEKYLETNGDSVAIIIINTPNNPSGAVYSADLLKKIADIVRKYPKIAIISDEVYRTIIYEDADTASCCCNGRVDRCAQSHPTQARHISM